ncbi:MAG: methionine--tRNA ligase [Deltaproteobacteria bacterium]|nr:methionine--tRNA ligase [Deltaproteobacteria bacterium]
MKPFYVTTPIYYVNDRPHIGHAYSTVAADVLARFQRLRGRPVRFLTGTDEHGQKIEEKAKELGKDPQAFVDEMSPPFREAFEELGCTFDDYIRTTDERHETRVQRLWQILVEKGDIYLGEYEGWYSVADEAFITEKEMEELDEVTRSKVQRVREKSYFFKLSAYGDKLLEFYENNPDSVQPQSRMNEVKSFVKGGLRDLSISRTSFKWGVPVPGDPEHVMYVWLDALTNYISALGGPAAAGEEELFDRFWSPSADVVHIVGKDILRFHAVYWPAFLMSAGIEPPSQVWAHGWLTVDGQKMSKRFGNFIPPGPLVQEFGRDVVRYYLMREVAFGQDGDFSHKNLIARYHGELGNGLGNLLNRMVASIVKKSLGGEVPAVEDSALTDLDRALIATAKQSADAAATHLDAVAPHRALDAIWELVGAANKYVDTTTPWKLAKGETPEDTARLAVVSYTVLEALRWLAVMLWPYMPDKCDDLLAQLGLPPVAPTEGTSAWPSTWGELPAGTETAPAGALFPRLDDAAQAEILTRLGVAEGEGKKAKPKPAANAKKAAADGDAAKKKSGPVPVKETITYEDFTKLDVRLGRVLEAEKLEKSRKLLRLTVDVGEAKPRNVMAGISQHYEPEALIGKRVVVVLNLAPRKIMGMVSEGMVLAASDDSALSVLTIDGELPPGTQVS